MAAPDALAPAAASAHAEAAVPLATGRSLWRRLLGHKLFVTGIILFGIVLAMALFADLLATAAPEKMNVRARFRTPEWQFLLGTDNYGRDIWSRLTHGARLSLSIGFAVVLATGVAGTLIGLLAGYFKRLDGPLMRFMDALMAFPAILLAIAIASALGPSAINAVLALSAVYTPRTARIVRSTVLVVREMDYVQAAVASGARHGWIIWRHILPNSLAPLIVQLTFIFAYAVLAESILSFLGVGMPPTEPSLGTLIRIGNQYLFSGLWWIVVFPAAQLCLIVLAVNLIGDWLRDALNPKLR